MGIIFQKQWDYTFSSKNDAFLLSVLCGTVGLFEIDIILSPDEIKKYHEEGQTFIEHLAESIRKNPTKWDLRKVN